MLGFWDELPEECWVSIFLRIDNLDQDLESLSLVCKRFLSISNRLRSSLTISNRTILASRDRSISPLFNRFRNIKRIRISDPRCEVDRLIFGVSRSDLKLEALHLSHQRRFLFPLLKNLGPTMGQTLKTLVLAHFKFLDDSDLVVIADLFPHLEVLDISQRSNPDSVALLTDSGIESLSAKLRKLRSINLSGNSRLSNKSLVALSLNCASLSEVFVDDSSFINFQGINFLIRHSSNLVSLSISGNMNFSYIDTIESFRSHGRAFCHLSLSRVFVPDQYLVSIGETNRSLQTLILSECHGFTFDGILSLHRVFQSIHRLDLEKTIFLNDIQMSLISEHFHHLISIGLNSCTNLTCSTLFGLVKNCLSLQEISMQDTKLGNGLIIDMNLRRNHSIRSLKLAWNKHLCDDLLEKIGIVCPNLRSLDVSHCWHVTDEGINRIGKFCTEITELRVDGCHEVHYLGLGLEFSKLEVLTASMSRIGDEGLGMIRRGCPRLRMMDLSGCLGVTEKGLKEIVGTNGGCKLLRDLNIKDCAKISACFLSWMVFSSPSLRNVVAPHEANITKQQRTMFLQHGCMVTL